jgi:pimeloyl-ACP methyl ester carboxylesterase
MDYLNIDGRTFTLAVVRHLATDQKNRIGTLFVNPGGPGGSAVDFAKAATQIVSRRIYQRFDIVGIDPRGVGASQPTRCLSDKEEDRYLAEDTTVLNKQDLNTVLSAAKNFALACAKSTGPKIGHYGSVEAAKDMDLFRQLLKEPKLNFLAKSYGTYIGTLYASLFPSKVGKIILDGAIDPNASNAQQNLIQAVGFEGALTDYLNKTKIFSKNDIENLLAGLRINPLKLPTGRELTPSLAIVAIASTLYDNKTGWPNLTYALKASINDQNPRPLFDLADEYNQRDATGHYSNENDISQIISCLDISERRNLSQMAADGAILKKRAPIFGPYLTYAGLTCKYWKHPASPKPNTTSISTAPVIVIGVTKDPATPYLWAKKLAAVFKGSTLITFNGEGHTGHNRGSSCVDNRVDSYLLGGPAGANLTC